MKPISSLALARQGNYHAIATILNKYLQPKGITFTVVPQRRRVMILAEALELPRQSKVTAFVQKCLGQVQPVGIKQVVLKGRVLGQQGGWQSTFDLSSPATQPSYHPPNPIKERRGMAGIILGLGVVAIASLGLWQTHHPQITHWEYRLEQVDSSLLQSTLDHFGAQGWELTNAPRPVSVDANPAINVYEVTFKRLTSNPGLPLVKMVDRPYPLSQPTSLPAINRTTLLPTDSADNAASQTLTEPTGDLPKAVPSSNAPLYPPPLPVPATP